MQAFFHFHIDVSPSNAIYVILILLPFFMILVYVDRIVASQRGIELISTEMARSKKMQRMKGKEAQAVQTAVSQVLGED